MLHGAAPVGNGDKLGLLVQSLQVFCEFIHIHIIQRRLNLIQQAKRRRADLQNGKVNGNGYKSLFAAGKGRQIFDDFARRLNIDFYARLQYVFALRQLQLRFTAAEQLHKNSGKMLVDLLKAAENNSRI